jgi:hypothetical protein
MLIMWICKNKWRVSRCYRYVGVVFEETMLVRVQSFNDDYKKECLTFCMNACI